MDARSTTKSAERTSANQSNPMRDDAPAQGSSTQPHQLDKDIIEERRDILLRGLDYGVPEIDIDAFVDNLLPPLRKGINVEDVVSSLKSEDLVTPGDMWRHFERPPSKTINAEDKVFAPLANICERVAHYASSNAHGLKQTFVLTLLHDAAPQSDTTRLSRPDGYFILKEAEEFAKAATNRKDKARWWYDIALTTEFKKKESHEGRNDNVSKLVFNMQQTMTLDPCRRFTFGITIENTNMRLWFCSRAIAVVSRTFDFTREIHLVTRVFLSFAFASKEELGWDPTIRPCIGSDGKRAYHIDVDKQTYETVEVLSEFAADTLVSRATRVWKVKRLGSEDLYVLKDVWVDEDRDLEHAVYKTILDDIEAKYGEEIRNEAASHLLTPAAHWIVPINGEVDHTTSVMLHGYTPSFKRRFKLKIKQPKIGITMKALGSSATCDMDVCSSRDELHAPFPRRLHRGKLVHQIHYRIVFKEVGKTINSVRSLSDIFAVLRDSAKVLEWIHGCGWVHRDISVGNLYLFDGRGLIGDLEYAKRRNFDVEREQRVGTLDFMALETSMRSYSYLPIDDDDDDLTIEGLRRLAEGKCEFPKFDEETPFFHNDLHDMESLWWVAIWELFNNSQVFAAGSRSEQTKQRVLERDSVSLRLFTGTTRLNERILFFQNRTVFEEMLAWLPGSLGNIKRCLNNLRRALMRQYKLFEADLPNIRTDLLQGAPGKFCQLFEVCRNCSNDVEFASRETIQSQHPLLVERDVDQTAQDLLSQSSGLHDEAETFDSSFSGCHFDTRGSSPGLDVLPEAGGRLSRDWLINYDFLTPMPALHVARYELEVW